MSFLFDDLSRVIASEVPRRKMLGMLGAAFGGAVMVSLGLRSAAFAQDSAVLKCGSGQIICNGKCCSGTCQDGRCCEKGMNHCGYECCPEAFICCSGHCCTCKTAVCFRGFCCESGIVCDGVCCEIGQTCIEGKCRKSISPTDV
jgi:hypothetical protein